MTDERKAELLRDALSKLMDAELRVKEALGGTDAGEDTLSLIGNAIEDLTYDIAELEDIL